MSSVYLVRHAMTVVDPVVPSYEWPLSDDGERAAAALELPALSVLTSTISLYAGLDFDEWRALPFPAVVEL